MSGAALAGAAAALVGTRFRLHGRNPQTGLDCIGLLGAAMAAIGRPLALPAGYPLRIKSLHLWLPDAASCGFAAVDGPARPGDVVLLVPGPAQFHLAITGPEMGWIHAHAGLRRVVCQPQIPDGRIVHHWRLSPPS